MIASNRVAPLGLLSQSTETLPEPLAPKKPPKASIEEIGPEPTKPVSLPNTQAPSTRLLVEAPFVKETDEKSERQAVVEPLFATIRKPGGIDKLNLLLGTHSDDESISHGVAVSESFSPESNQLVTGVKGIVENGTFFFRAATGDRSPDILAWQASNRASSAPWVQDFLTGFHGAKPSDVGYVFVGMFDAAIGLGGATLEEVNRYILNEQTKTGQVLSAIENLLTDPYLPHKIGRTVYGCGGYIADDIVRLYHEEPTKIGSATKSFLSEVGATSQEDLIKNGGEALLYYLAGEAVAKGALMAAQKLQPVVSKTYTLTERAAAEFLAIHEFRLPVTFGFETERFYCFPGQLDIFKFQNPIPKKDLLLIPASSVNAQAALKSKLRALEKLQDKGVIARDLGDGRIRYYEREKLSEKPGTTRGCSHVLEYNFNNGQVRTWMECYNQDGVVNRVHPKMQDGSRLSSPHFPPTGAELEALRKNKPGIK